MQHEVNHSKQFFPHFLLSLVDPSYELAGFPDQVLPVFVAFLMAQFRQEHHKSVYWYSVLLEFGIFEDVQKVPKTHYFRLHHFTVRHIDPQLRCQIRKIVLENPEIVAVARCPPHRRGA